ncbi:MAG: hypothetical protein JSS14_15550 [Proteobacteria bacterium]|nr:hypothetical protein [Pseudomonadota bacterium]
MANYKFVNTLSLGQILGQGLIWLVLIVLTLGLATPFFAYYFIKLLINTTEMHEIAPPAQLRSSFREPSL